MPLNKKLDPEIVGFAQAHQKQYNAIYSAIKRYQKIVVFRHIKPDFDAMGTQMGVYTFIKDNFPEKEVHFVGDNHVTFTPRLFPATESLPNDWFASRDFLAIICDVGDKERIADPRFAKAKYKIKIDHHPCKAEVAPKATVCDLSKAAAAEVAANILLSWKGTKLTAEAARYLYIGLVGDSGRFMFSSTTGHTFAIAKALIETGFDLRSTYLSMYEKKLDSLYSQAYVLSNFRVSPHGVAYYLLPCEVQEKLKITTEQGKENVNMFSNIEGINAWCSITEDPDPKEPCWRISIRSKKEDISPIAFKWGGGGHAQASGAKIKDLSELDAFIGDLDALFA